METPNYICVCFAMFLPIDFISFAYNNFLFFDNLISFNIACWLGCIKIQYFWFDCCLFIILCIAGCFFYSLISLMVPVACRFFVVYYLLVVELIISSYIVSNSTTFKWMGGFKYILVRWQGCYTLEFNLEIINLICYRNKCLANLYNGLLDNDEENLK